MNELLDNLLMEEWANQSLPRHQERKHMSISLRTKPGDRLLELGGGACPLVRPNCDVRACVDANGNPTVDIVADFEKPLPFADAEWDGIFCQYALEHISFHKIPAFIREVFRICKVGAKIVFVLPNIEAQFKWIKDHLDGWDGKDFFTAASELVFGSLDYSENSHKAYLSPSVATGLFAAAGFEQIQADVYNERGTDLVLQAIKPNVFGTNVERRESNMMKTKVPSSEEEFIDKGFQIKSGDGDQSTVSHVVIPSGLPREQVFDKHYFNGGSKVGGYAREGYWDYPVHWVTFNHVLAKRPQSVLELGCGRGYILKRLEDVGIPVTGLEISKHCWLTRVCYDVIQHDLCNVPWPIPSRSVECTESYDLCFSIATFEHIPEEFLPRILDEMKRTCKRGLHGIDFGDRDDGFDKTHVTLKPYEWWRKLFDMNGLQSHDIVDKEELEKGSIPLDVRGDGKIKLNIGSHITMHHHGWVNIDVHDLHQFAQQNGFNFLQYDVRAGLPYKTGAVDLIFACHFLEHLNYREGVAFLRDCRRVLKADGALRLLVPNASLLTDRYCHHPEPTDVGSLDELDEINDGSAACPTAAGKLWSLLFSGHQAMYDFDTLARVLHEAGFTPHPASFRRAGCIAAGCSQILRETIDMQPAISLHCDATPQLAFA